MQDFDLHLYSEQNKLRNDHAILDPGKLLKIPQQLFTWCLR